MLELDFRSMNRRRLAGLATGAALGFSQVSAFAQSATLTSSGKLTIYCGRNEELVGPMIPRIAEVTGIDLDVRFGNTAELAAQIHEEGSKTPAGLYFCQDAGALGALAQENRFAVLPAELLDQVEPQFRSPDGVWIGLSGRVRVLLYNPEVTDPATLPKRIIDLPKEELNGPIGGAFQCALSVLRDGVACCLWRGRRPRLAGRDHRHRSHHV